MIIIPIFVIIFYFYPETKSNIENQILLDSKITLEHKRNSLDTALHSVINNYISIKSERRLTSSYLNENAQNRYEGLELLKRFLDVYKIIVNNDNINVTNGFNGNITAMTICK